MIKGKFYAGLPSEMMTRSRTVDRQQTNFFWPDETDAEAATSTRSKRIVSKSTTANNNNINNNSTDTSSTQSDIKPKELFRKQLSSGIEFYDNVNAKTPESRRRRFKKIENINLNNNNDNDFQPEKKKLETFSSKIEFYDFEPVNSVKKSDLKEKIEKPVGKAINIDDAERCHDDENEKNKMDSPDVGKKRISFQTTDKTVEKTKGILKNSDERPIVDKFIVKPLPKRGLFPKNLSKSVENISKMAQSVENDEVDNDKPVEKLSTIIREVKNLNLSKDDDRRNNYRRKDERDVYYRGKDNERRSNLDRDYDRGYNSRSGYRYDERNESPPSYKYNNNRYNDFDDDRKYSDRRNERYQRNSYAEGRIRDRHSPSSYDHYDNYYEREEHDVESKRGPPRTPIRDVKAASPARDIQRKSIDRYYDEPSNRTVQRVADDEDEYSACISRKPKHIPQHLRTNILFNGRVRPQAQRPMSVRNSAVTRVGVGLPDIE